MSTKHLIAAIAGVAGLAALAVSAQAAPIFLISVTNGSTTHTVADNGTGDTDLGTSSISANPTLTGYSIGSITADYSVINGIISFDLNGLTLKKTASGTGTLTISATVLGLTSASGSIFIDDAFSGTNAHNGSTVRSSASTQVYIDTGNGAFALTTLLANSGTISTQGINGPDLTGSLASLSGPFSLTIVKTVTFAGTSTSAALVSDSLSAAVPEPASMLLLGSGLLGAGWIGSRRRRKSGKTAA